MMLVFLLASIPFSICRAQVKNDEEKVVNKVLSSIDDCLHWVGEAGEGDAERTEQITKGFQRTCSLAQKKAQAAYKQYPHNPTLAARILGLIDIFHFDASDAEKRRICEAALAYFKADYSTSKEEGDGTFRAVCPSEAKILYGK